jgi:DtxR family Mn-dependent transcriptional regulator
MDEPIKEFEEMYLKTLYEFFTANPDDPVRTNALSEAMGVSAASASEMVKRLAKKGLLIHEPYKGARLSDEGFEAAARIKRREGLMEVFLVRMIGYTGDVKAAACRLEHALTDDLEAAIDRLLGYPEHTPEGEQIPPVTRLIELISPTMLVPLRALPEGMDGSIELMVLEGADVRTLEQLGIVTGTRVRSTGDGYQFDGLRLNVSKQLASRILVRTL